MAQVLRECYNFYLNNIQNARDKRLEGYFLIEPWMMTVLGLSYLYFVNFLGPKLMESRKPFQLKRTMIVYNALQVILNLTMGCMAVRCFIEHRVSLRCQLTDYSWNDRAIYEAKLTYYYYLLKVFDLLDTVFFIARKKYNQVTFLHVYHHFGMASLGCFFVNYMPAGHVSMLGIINCFVHVIMYFYYLMTCLNSRLKSSIWWKKHLTNLQLIQFAYLIFHFAQPLIFGNCSYSKIILAIAVIQNLFMFIMFSDFYYKAYVKKRDNSKEKLNVE